MPGTATRRACLLAGLALAWPAVARTRPAARGELLEWPSLSLLDGPTLPPAAWGGMAAILVFWSTICPFCKRHNAHVDRLFRSTRGLPLRVLGVALDRDAGAGRRYLDKNDFRFPVTLEAGKLRERLSARQVVPTTCLIDRSGCFVEAIPGEMFEEDVLGLARVASPSG